MINNVVKIIIKNPLRQWRKHLGLQDRLFNTVLLKHRHWAYTVFLNFRYWAIIYLHFYFRCCSKRSNRYFTILNGVTTRIILISLLHSVLVIIFNVETLYLCIDFLVNFIFHRLIQQIADLILFSQLFSYLKRAVFSND